MSFIGNILGDITGSNQQAQAAQNAANTQASSANYAAQLQNQAFQQLQQRLAPYSAIGTGILPSLLSKLGYSGTMDSSGNLSSLTPSNTGLGALGTFSFNPTQAQLEQTPGYQFTLQQGLKGVDNAASAKGWGQSGAQAKAIGDYTTGLANQTYQQQYQNALQNYQTNYNAQQGQVGNLLNLLGVGQNAAAGVGTAGMNTANQIGNLATQAANAQAAGMTAMGNQQSNAVNSALNLGLGGAGIYSLLSKGGLLSDARMKTDIKHIGFTPGGHKVYSFKYKGSNVQQIGVMAQEVEKTVPSAVITINGVKRVDYSKVN